MRLWHVEMLPFLPLKQLRGQWREIIALVSMLQNPRFKNHPLVKKLKEYPKADFYAYVKIYLTVLKREGYEVSEDTFLKVAVALDCVGEIPEGLTFHPFKDWHNDRYLLQCYHNLEEKFDLGLIPENEFRILENFIKNRRW